VSRKGEKGNAYRGLVETAGWKGALGSTARSWKDYTNMDIKELGWEGMD
jgi:hypothetical protein